MCNSVRSPSTSLLNARLGYKLTDNVSTRLDVNNALDTRAPDVSYYYVSRLPGEPAAGVADTHFHAAEPIGFRLSLVAHW